MNLKVAGVRDAYSTAMLRIHGSIYSTVLLAQIMEWICLYLVTLTKERRGFLNNRKLVSSETFLQFSLFHHWFIGIEMEDPVMYSGHPIKREFVHLYQFFGQ